MGDEVFPDLLADCTLQASVMSGINLIQTALTWRHMTSFLRRRHINNSIKDKEKLRETFEAAEEIYFFPGHVYR
ncbi:hypothetical protein E2C01_078419 [Portunus trituberculatus]|uniref:Uncharacterized protein n=1 Tax=Portunus trituberculatus TaxID=210409 RepID=A0A5B7IU34_PORTR|nr:hypothetical protein [Portunus trituberculatus]